jgi:putative ABC transport system permease protein
MWMNTLLLALREIRRNLLRSFLTMLGIVIGVSAVITMVTLGSGATRAVQTQIASLGSNLLMVMPGQRMGPGSSGGPAFNGSDVEAIGAQIGGVRLVAPEVRSSAVLVANGRNWSAGLTGSTQDWFSVSNWSFAGGRGFEPDEERVGAAVCVIGATVRRELFGSADPIGAQIRVRKFSCTVVGWLHSKGQGAMGNDQDNLLVLPLATMQRRVVGHTRINTILVSMSEGSDAARVKENLEELMRERRKLADNEDNNFNVLDTRQIADTMSGTTQIMTLLLGAVAAVSLVVGGIGIMNIMLVSVTERTREIGVRLAIGALEREVLLQFLVEAVVLAALGGLIGIVLATAASIGIAQLMGIPYAFDPKINVASFLFSAAIGVVFGYFPARRAARLDPIDALRHE